MELTLLGLLDQVAANRYRWSGWRGLTSTHWCVQRLLTYTGKAKVDLSTIALTFRRRRSRGSLR